MSIAELILDLSKQEIHLRLVDGKLRMNAAKGSISEELLSRVKERREEIIRFLSYEQAEYYTIPTCDVKEYYVLSSAQKRLYILHRLAPESTAYNMPLYFALPTEIERDKLDQVINSLVARHESLRTTFELKNNDPVQRIHENVKVGVEHINISAGQIEIALNDLVRPFVLERGPLFRVFLIEMAGSHHLLLDMHHIITDGVSQDILKKEFICLLRGEQLSPLPIQYKDYSEWQNSDTQRKIIATKQTYWEERLSGKLSRLNLPADFPRPAMQSFEGAHISFALTHADTVALKQLAKHHGTTMYMTLIALYAIFLSKLSGQEDIIIGTPVAGRQRAELDGVVGMFVNTLAFRCKVDAELTVSDFLDIVKKEVLGALAHQEYPFDDLVSNLTDERHIGRNPVFDAMFNLLNYGQYSEINIDQSSYGRHLPGTSKCDISLTAVDCDTTILFNICYCTALFTSRSIDRFINNFRNIIAQVPSMTSEAIASVQILDANEKARLLRAFNSTDEEYDRSATVQTMFEAQVERTPGKNSVFWGEQRLTFGQLNEKSNQLAHKIRGMGVGRGAIVALLFDASPAMIVAIMGVLKSGAAYLPLNTDLPSIRVRYILEDSASVIVLTNNEAVNEDMTGTRVIMVDCGELAGPVDNPANENLASDPAYVIYTSGTTGKPKGVVVTHQNLVNYNVWFGKTAQFADDNTALVTSYAFDLGYTALYSALLNGCGLHLLHSDIYSNPAAFARYISENSITYLKLTPSLFSLLLEAKGFAQAAQQMRLIVLGGEPVRADAIERSFAYNNKLRFINHYGPTETTIGCITASVTEENIKEFSIYPYIGYPISNMRAYILDNRLALVPIGVAGELCISGDGLAKGYLNSSELTESRFITHPFEPGKRLYRTGDLACRMEDGNIRFLGRMDHQVKIRGFRVEPGEISSLLRQHPCVEECVVIDRGEGELKHLCAYVVPVGEVNAEILCSYLVLQLPAYMIPQHIIFLPSLPLNRNGKLDRASLPKPEANAGEAFQAPATDTENVIASMWSEILLIPIEQVGRNTSFFSLGGNSLKAISLISMIDHRLGVEIMIREIFSLMTVKNVAERIDLLKSDNEKILLSQLDNLSDEELESLLRE